MKFDITLLCALRLSREGDAKFVCENEASQFNASYSY